MTLESDTLPQLQIWWDAICSAFFQSQSTSKSWSSYKKTKAENYNITKFLLPPDAHYEYITAKENVKHCQEHSEFILLNIPPSHNKNHQNHMSNLLLICTTTMDFNFLLQLYSPRSPNLEYLDSNLKTL